MRGHRRWPLDLPGIAVLRPTSADRLGFCSSVTGPMHLFKSHPFTLSTGLTTSQPPPAKKRQ